MSVMSGMLGTVGGLLGGGGGAGGTGFSGPTGVTPDQLAKSYADQQAALKQQQDFANAVQAQHGLANQSQVFGQLNDISQGKGPNPAQAMLNQQAGKNQAAQSAAQASQRGSSANAGLIARQASQTGANIQQDTAGQAATLQAQQALNAINSMGNISNAQVQQQSSALQGLNQYSLQGQGNLLGLQGNINSANAGMANTRMGQQPGALSGVGSAIGGPLSSGVSNLMGGGGGGSNFFNSPAAGGADAYMAADQAVPGVESATDMAGGAGDLVTAGEAVAAAEGGAVSDIPTVESNDVAADNVSGPKSFVGRYFNDTPISAAPAAAPKASGGGGLGSIFQGSMGAMGGMGGAGGALGLAGGAYSMYSKNNNELKNWGAGVGAGGVVGGMMNQTIGGGSGFLGADKKGLFAEGGSVPALVSPGEVYLDPKDVKKVKKGADPIKAGEKIPGKPKHPGNDYRNDTVKKNLDEGGIVIPNAILQGPNAHWNAMRFVHATMKKSKNGKR